MASPYQVRQLQRSINSFNDRYSLGQGHVAVDSAYGPRTAEESRWMQWLLGMPAAQVGKWPIDTVILWLAHPSVYWAGPPPRTDQYAQHRKRLAGIRQSNGGHNLTVYDGLTIAKWLVPYNDDAKRTGDWHGYGIPGDQACGWRGPVGKGLQAWLYKRYLAGVEPGPVAPPGTSRHEFCDCTWCRQHATLAGHKGGAEDVANASRVERGDLRWAGPGDPPHCSSRDTYNATGRY